MVFEAGHYQSSSYTSKHKFGGFTGLKQWIQSNYEVCSRNNFSIQYDKANENSRKNSQPSEAISSSD